MVCIQPKHAFGCPLLVQVCLGKKSIMIHIIQDTPVATVVRFEAIQLRSLSGPSSSVELPLSVGVSAARAASVAGK